MRKFLRFLFKWPITWLGNYFSAAPVKADVFKSLSELYDNAQVVGNNTCIFIEAEAPQDKFIIFSDQHKGNKTWADDFKTAEKGYTAALEYYNNESFNFINLGDCEELWKFKVADILPHNENVLKAEAAFQPEHYYRTFGNHDLIWKNKIDVNLYLKKYFQEAPDVHEGIVIHLKHGDSSFEIFLTHGHQGDVMSDNNSFSTWVVAHLWMPVQRYLHLNINTPSQDFSLRNKHNEMMHEWSTARKNLILVTGHTHSPVFASGRYFKHPNNIIAGTPADVKPCYFNAGCCCFSDGNITGIEIADGFIRLIKWHWENDEGHRIILEEIELNQLCRDLGQC